ncbi:MAG: phosphoribosyltransferase family protein [Candidatus Micrarchaeia archaeon]|jgi:hypothetical protein
MGEISPTSRTVHDADTKKNIMCYYSGKYYAKSTWGKDEYSWQVYNSKDNDSSEKFWPQFERTFLYARKMEQDNFDCSCLMPGHDRPHNKTCGMMQEKLKQQYSVEPHNVLIKTPGCRKSYTMSSAERFQEIRAHAAVSASISVNGKSVILLDDILATGAHVAAYGSLLYKCGAKNVAVVVIAENELR